MQNLSKRVLIITYYWPPSAGSGVQRWLKFAKYLPEYGWEPVIFTPENPDFELKDESLGKEINPQMEVLKFPIWEPYQLFRKLKKEKIGDTAKVLEKKQKSWADHVGILARANLLVPDPRRFWVKPSAAFLLDLIQKGQFQAIITTGPPHSMHLIGLELKRKTGIPWLADFRDPWSKWEFLDTLPMLNWIRKIHKKMELSILKEADTVTTISPTFQLEFEAIHPRKIELLTNGFDPADLPADFWTNTVKSDSLEILYTGVIDAIRNPIPFLSSLKSVFEQSSKNVNMRFVGKVSDPVQAFIEADIWLKTHVKLEGYVSHEEVFAFYKKANLLLLILTDTKNAQGNIPGKIFEYMATGRPILALGDPQGDAADILEKSKSGKVFSHQDLKGIRDFLENFENKAIESRSTFIEQYSRITLTKKLAHLLDAQTDTIS